VKVLMANVTLLSNGNYVVESPYWSGERGAVTWGDGSAGINGTVSSANSVVGSNRGDLVGALPNGSFAGTDLTYNDVTLLSNGNYVVLSPNWNGKNGAATWVSGRSGQTLDGSGTITPQNSLIGNVTNAGLRSVVDNPNDQTFLTTFLTETG